MDVLDNMFIIASALIKNKSYSYEEESRLIFNRWRMKDVKFRTDANNNIIPYVYVGIPIEKLKQIVIGPRCDFKTVKQALMIRFIQMGISLSDENIIKSNIPYR